MASTRAPKQWSLTEHESLTSFESWQANILYILTLDKNFTEFLTDGATWTKKTSADPNRGFTSDNNRVAEDLRRTAQQKVQMLELMLGQIANYAPIISRNTIIKNSTSLCNIWQSLRLHYGFQTTGAHFLDFAEIKPKPEERPETLFQRIMSFVEDNLLKQGGGLTHHGDPILADEDMSPTLENLTVLFWLRLLHEGLPRLVRQRYGTELRQRTLASIKPEISQALPSLLEELATTEDVRIMRSAGTSYRRDNKPTQPYPSRQSSKSRVKMCPLCQQSRRPDFHHYLSQCPYLPENDRLFLTKARHIMSDEFQNMDDQEFNPSYQPDIIQDDLCANTVRQISRRVALRQSPYLNAFFNQFPLRLTIDTGAETNMIRSSVAQYINATITPSTQIALQADGITPLTVVGETRLSLSHGRIKLRLEALVVEELDVDILAGTPFMTFNDISVRPARNQIAIGDSIYVQYGSHTKTPNHHSVRAVAHVLRAPSVNTTLWPGDFIELDTPHDVNTDDYLAIEPRMDSQLAKSYQQLWPEPAVIQAINGKIRLTNTTLQPVNLHKYEQFGQIHHTSEPTKPEGPVSQILQHTINVKSTRTDSDITLPFSAKAEVDPDELLSSSMRAKFHTLHHKYDSVFNPEIGCYNGSFGNIESVVNIGPVQPPQRKGRMPQYARNRLVELQTKFDELEQLKVIRKPEDVGVIVEYLNPSFLIKKPDGGSRLVTAFGEVGQYSKPQPSLMPDVESTLRTIAKWKFLVKTDLTKAFYQIPLSPSSMKYCGVATPFKGTRVYCRSAMGMPGSETALEELMSRVLGDLLTEGVVVKLADDLYCGSDTPDELLDIWERVLRSLVEANLRLSVSKTIICPKTTTILGWIWSDGTITAGKHRISALSSSSRPDNVRGLRSFVGAYKVLSRVIKHSSVLLSPLENAIAGKDSRELITWTDSLTSSFLEAQNALQSNKQIVLPRPNDHLWIVTDGSVKMTGLGSTLYVSRNGKLHLAGFFSAKLKKHQVTWLPCEIEALSITAAIRHFSPYIIQSAHQASVLTDSKPCVQAYQKLCRGEFSASTRVTTFLSTSSRYHVNVQHLSGSANVPSDFASRNAPECSEPSCQVCTFITACETCVIRSTLTEDVLSGNSKMPYTSPASWQQMQHECSDLRRVHAHLTQGTRPSKKLTNIKDVKRYLRTASIGRNGLLVVKRDDPLSSTRECTIVPRQVLDDLLVALHIKFNHPSKHQLKLLFQRHFYALDIDAAIDLTSTGCHLCASLKKIPVTLQEQSTSEPPERIGLTFAADVMKRNRQCVLILRETVTSYTTSCIILDEQKDTLRSALIQLCLAMIPLDSTISIRVDPAPAFKGLVDDQLLQQHGIKLVIGRPKNINKNPVAEHAILELTEELLRFNPGGGCITPLTLAITTARMNSRIRNRGLSAREMWTQRDQFSNYQIHMSDTKLIQDQHNQRLTNHPHSERAKAPGRQKPFSSSVSTGDIVYITSDGNKLAARDRYIVISTDGNWCTVRKFAGSQLRSAPYQVKITECYRVPDSTLTFQSPGSLYNFEYDNQEECAAELTSGPSTDTTYIPGDTNMPVSEIPPVLSLPATPDETLLNANLESQVASQYTLHDTDPSTQCARRHSNRSKTKPLYLSDYVA